MRFGPLRRARKRPSLDWRKRWCARYGPAGRVFLAAAAGIRHLIGIPVGILRMDFRWYALATLAGSLLWCSVLAWLGIAVGQHPELLAGSLHRFFALVLAAAAGLGALYYVFVVRASARK